MAELKGQVVLLFFWAHWCPDCKAQSPIVARLLEEYRVAGADGGRADAAIRLCRGGPSRPRRMRSFAHIVQIRDTYYGFLRDEPVPVSEANHKRYGVSTTPTLALVDRGGIVRLYHPGQMTEEELEAAIRRTL